MSHRHPHIGPRAAVIAKAAGITMLAFALSLVLMQPFSASTAALFATPEKNDFNTTDFYNMVADSRAVSRLDDNIVIVNIDFSDRDGIADIIDIATLAGARAVGLDAMFSSPRDGDGRLLDAINSCPSIVQPMVMERDPATGLFSVAAASYFHNTPLDTASVFAAANLPTKYRKSMVRELQPAYPVAAGDTVDAFAVAIARIADPDAAATLRDRRNTLETVNYHSRRFRTIEPDDLIASADLLTGRIVLIGALNEPADLHNTPVDATMAGILVHAHSLATVLDRDYMTSVPKWLNILIALILCFFIVTVSITLTSGAKGLVMRLLQVGLLYATVQIGYWCFVTHKIIIDFSYALLMLAFGFFACDIWNGAALIGSRALARIRALIKSPESRPQTPPMQ